MKHDNTWDLRVTKDMVDFYNKTKKEGNNYFWNFNLSSAITLFDLLSKAYQVNKPDLLSCTKKVNQIGINPLTGKRTRAYYEIDTKRITMRARNHIKTIIHEFYHHLDNVTGLYNSSDELCLANKYADKMYEILRKGIINYNKDTLSSEKKVSKKFKIKIKVKTNKSEDKLPSKKKKSRKSKEHPVGVRKYIMPWNLITLQTSIREMNSPKDYDIITGIITSDFK